MNIRPRVTEQPREWRNLQERYGGRRAARVAEFHPMKDDAAQRLEKSLDDRPLLIL
jgi:hypothetical protein